MKKILFLLLVIGFCHHSYSQDFKSLDKDHSTDWQTLTNDYMTWYTYTYLNIHLSNDFIGLDIDSSVIDKPKFLNELLTGKVFVFKIGTKEENDVYRLYPLNSKDESIIAVTKEMASTEIRNRKKEGTLIPTFTFTDLNGNIYDNTSTKGKLIVLKCWFIHCVACVKEFPDLNKIVNNYKNNDKILFISLASDRKEDLVKFLKTKKFKYAVVPEMKNFMINDLNITQYPTHILIDGTGKIVKVVNRIEELMPFLEKAAK